MFRGSIEHLANTLSDSEFETLLRLRMQKVTASYEKLYPDAYESHTSYMFRWSPARGGEWTATGGKTYDYLESRKGEVLSICVAEVVNGLLAREVNKISVLLTYDADPHGPPSDPSYWMNKVGVNETPRPMDTE